MLHLYVSKSELLSLQSTVTELMASSKQGKPKAMEKVVERVVSRDDPEALELEKDRIRQVGYSLLNYCSHIFSDTESM